jgi:hypothetical protein
MIFQDISNIKTVNNTHNSQSNGNIDQFVIKKPISPRKQRDADLAFENFING